MRSQLIRRTSLIALSAPFLLALTGCAGKQADRASWFKSLSVGGRVLVILGPLALLFVVPLILLLLFGERKHSSKSKAYWFYVWICLVVGGVGVIIYFLWVLLSTVVMGMVHHWLIIAIVVASLTALVLLGAAAASENTRASRDRTGAFIAGLIAAVADVLLIVWQVGVFSSMRSENVALVIFTTLLTGLFVVAIVQALSPGFGRRQRWWFAGACLAAVCAAAAMSVTLVHLLPHVRSRLEISAAAHGAFYLIGCAVVAVCFPVPVARAFYKIVFGDDVTVTRTRKSAAQHQYVNAGYRCAQCGGELPGQVAQCPHCGVRFNASREEYLPGTPAPKPTRTKKRSTTPAAGTFLAILLVADVLCAVFLVAARNSAAFTGSAYWFSVAGVVGANVVVVVAAVLLVKRYRGMSGSVERTTYY